MQVAMSRIEFPKCQCQLFNLHYIEMDTAANDGFPPPFVEEHGRPKATVRVDRGEGGE